MRINSVILLLLVALAPNQHLNASEYGQNDDEGGGAGNQASSSQGAPANNQSDPNNSDGTQTADGSSGGDGIGGSAGGPGGGSDLSSAGGGAGVGSGRAAFAGGGGGAQDACYKLCGPGTPDYNPERLGNCVHQVESGLPADCNSWFSATSRDVANIRQGVTAREAAGVDKNESNAEPNGGSSLANQ